MKDLLVRIRFQLPSLPRAEKIVAEALLDNPEAITNLTLAKLASETGSSDASIIRFCKRMGFNGYTDFKNAFMSADYENLEAIVDNDSEQEDMLTILQKVCQGNIQTLTDTLALASSNYEEALEAMYQAKSIHFFGVGDAYAVCLLAHMKISRLGITSSAYSDVMQQFVTAGNLGPGDVAFAVSYEGRTKNVLEAMKMAKKNGATTICITKMSKSPLIRVTDIALFISISDLTIGREKLTRRVADQAILDALFVGLRAKKGKTAAKKLQQSQSAMDVNKI